MCGRGVSEYRYDISEALRETLKESEHDTRFWVQLTEAQALDLASGYVPTAVKAMMLTMLEWNDEDIRKAARPTRRTPRRKP